MNDFNGQLKKRVEEIETVIGKYLPEETGYQATVLKAMNYSILAGGKRLRPMLMWETYKLFGGQGKEIEPFMAAIEMIHTYSLVHDDLPAMDNDEYRRGRKTTHVVFGEAFAILAGDALLNYAFEVALKSMVNSESEKLYEIGKALQVLAKKAGIFGMIGGQTADIEAEALEKVSTEQLLFIHEHKTAALVQAAMMIGAILAGADETEVERIEKCAYDIGIAFQIQDDILDVVGTMEELGKPIGSDAKNNKQTYVTLNGMEVSRQRVKELSEEAIGILDTFGGNNTFLKELIISLIHRSK